MNYTIMNMSVPHILGFKIRDNEMKMALQASWSRADVVWERISEQAIKFYQNGEYKKAKLSFYISYWLSKLYFNNYDLRRSNTLVNLALISKSNAQKSDKYLKQALEIWQFAPKAIQRMQILPRSRSSLFHLRMETRHRETFHTNMRHRIGLFANEFAETVQAIQSNQTSPHRHYSRWLGERPVVYDDTRKILSACLLLIEAAD